MALHNWRSSRITRFFLIHAVFSVIAGAMYLKNFPHAPGKMAQQYVVAAVEAFFGSLGAAFLSLALLVKGFLYGFAGGGMMEIMGHGVPFQVAAGVAAIAGFVLLVSALNTFGKTGMNFAFAASSALFLYVSYIYLIDIVNATERLLRF